MASVAAMMTRGGSVLRVVNHVLASPRAFSIGAPIEGSEETAMIGAAENSPRADGTPEISTGTRMTIAVKSPSLRSPASSTPKDAATESADAPLAIDTDVALAKTHVVDDPSDSGAIKLGPGVFIGTPVPHFASSTTMASGLPRFARNDIQGPSLSLRGAEQSLPLRRQGKQSPRPCSQDLRNALLGQSRSQNAVWQLNSCWLFSGGSLGGCLTHLRIQNLWQHR